jgi:Rieske Fe-S protein
MTEPKPSRRRVFLKMLAASVGSAAIAACIGQGGTGSSGTSGGTVSAGNVSALAANDLQAISGEGVAIGRDSGGLYAVSLICTHQGCDMSSRGTVDVSGIYCNCHGASYDRYGIATGGPTQGDLEHYAVSVDAQGAITIDLGTTIDVAHRVVAA